MPLDATETPHPQKIKHSPKRPVPGERQHFATLDGLRGIAALVVVAFHALKPFDLSSMTPHATLAVDFFFCLSGFVIGYAYESRLLSTMSFTDFVAARLIRLYPLILAGLLLGFIVYLAKGLAAHQSPFTSNLLVVIFLETFLVPNPLTLGEGWTEFPPLDPPAWSLFFEFLANFAYAAFITRLTKKAMTYLLILSAIVVFGQAYVLGEVGGGNHWHNLAGGLGRVFFPFLCGLFLFRRWRKRPARESSKFARLVPIALLAVLLCPVPSSLNWLYESCAVVILFPLIIDAATMDKPKSHTGSVYLFLGKLSYPLYILHYPLIRPFSNFARAHELHGTGFWLLIAAEILGAMGLSFLLLKFFDEPVRAWLTQKWRTFHAPAQSSI